MLPAVGVHVVNVSGIVKKEASNVETSLKQSDSKRCSALHGTNMRHKCVEQI